MVAFLTARKDRDNFWLDQIHIGHMHPFFAGRNMGSLTGKDIRVYTSARTAAGIKPSTINRELVTLSASINWARTEMELELPNPVTGRKLKEPEARIRWITKAESLVLLKAAESKQAPYLVDFIDLALNTGCRRGELLGLEWTRVDFGQGLIHLEASHTKAKKRRTVPINATARAALVNRTSYRSEHCASSRWVFSNRQGERIASIKTAWGAACKRARIENFHIHDMRHTCAAWLVQAKVPLPQIRDLLGHASITMTEK